MDSCLIQKQLPRLSIVEDGCDKYRMYFPTSTLPLSRQAWALVSEVGGGNASCSEDVREHENHDTGGRALASRNFTTVDGVGFSVTAYSEWKNGTKSFVSKYFGMPSSPLFIAICCI